MNYETITVEPVSPHIGAEIGNVDLTRPLSNKQVEELHARSSQLPGHLLPRSENQLRRSDPARPAISGRSGSMSANRPSARRPTIRYVRKFHYDEKSTQISGENFHSDQSCAEIPPLGSILYNHTVPPDGGGDTMFASMYAAYDALSPRMKTYLTGLTATHDGTRVFGPGTPVSVHPVIIRHPVTGRKVIYVNTDFTSKINELPRLEGDRVLQFLIDHCDKPEWTCRFRWARIRSRSGITVARTTRRSGIIGRTCVPAIASKSRERPCRRRASTHFSLPVSHDSRLG